MPTCTLGQDLLATLPLLQLYCTAPPEKPLLGSQPEAQQPAESFPRSTAALLQWLDLRGAEPPSASEAEAVPLPLRRALERLREHQRASNCGAASGGDRTELPP